MSRRHAASVLLLLFLLAAGSIPLACSMSRPNVTRYMKEKESSLAVQRCLERFIHLLQNRSVSMDIELSAINRESRSDRSQPPSPENLNLGVELCMALYFDEDAIHQ